MTFLTAIIFRSPGVAVTLEINMMDNKLGVVFVWHVMLMFSIKIKHLKLVPNFTKTPKLSICKFLVGVLYQKSLID